MEWEEFRPVGFAEEPPAPAPIASGSARLEASSICCQGDTCRRRRVPAAPVTSSVTSRRTYFLARGESERSNDSHTGRPFLLPQPRSLVRLPLDRTAPESTRTLGVCEALQLQLLRASSRTQADKHPRVLISRPFSPVSQNSIPPFLLAIATTSLLPRCLLRFDPGCELWLVVSPQARGVAADSLGGGLAELGFCSHSTFLLDRARLLLV